MTLDDFLAELQKRAIEAGSQKRLALDWGLKPSEVSDCFNKRRPPPKRLLEKAGFEMVPDYRPRLSINGKPASPSSCSD